ncbi:MAG: Single-stranded DNA binding protein [Halobacteriales archaeon]
MGDTQGETDVASRARRISEEVDADPDEVESRLRNLLEYSVPMDEALRTVRRRYESTSSSEPTSEPVSIDDLSVGDTGVSVEVVVLSAGRRSVNAGGDLTTIHEGEVADESDVIAYTSWEDFPFEPGDSVEIEDAEVREWNGEPQLNLGSNTRVRETEDVDALREPYGTRDLDDLDSGDRGVDVEAVVVSSETREINGRDGETTITSGTLGDASGRLQFTDWENRGLREGDAVRIENAYVNEYRGLPQVNMGEYTEIAYVDEVTVDGSPPEVTVAEAVEGGGDFDVVVEGDVLEVKEGSGIVERCPDCGRVVQRGQCRAHGEVDAEVDMRVKAVVDDGTGALNLIAGRELTEKIYGGSLEDARSMARDAMDRGVVEEAIAERAVGQRWRVRGDVSVGDYGANIDAREIDEVDDDPRERALEVLDGF